MNARPIPEANNFDFLRFGLAAALIVSHSYAMLPGRLEPVAQFGRFWSLGDLAVNGFFIISGFLVTHSWLRSRGAGDYARKRALRIYPGFIVAMLLCGLVVLPLGSRGEAWLNTPSEIGAQGLRTILLQRYVAPEAFADPAVHALPHVINGATWTIFYELLCYMLVPLIVALGLLKRRRRLVAALAMMLALHAGTYHLDAFWRWRAIFSFDPVQAIRFFTYFGAGVCFYSFRDAIPCRGWIAALAALASVAALRWPALGAAALPLLLTYVIFWFAFCPRVRLHKFARYGDFSYGMYIYGGPIQQLVIMWAGGALAVGALMGVSLAAAILAGALSWHLVEKHFMRMKRFLPASQERPNAGWASWRQRIGLAQRLG